MNNLDKITDRITDEAKKEADAIIKAAVENASALSEDAETSASDKIAMAKKTADRETLAAIERAYSAADMKKREILLAAKVGLINRVFADAEEKLLALDTKEYNIFVGHLLADAVSERTETVQKLREEYGDEEEADCCFEAIFNGEDKKTRASSILKNAKSYLKKKYPDREAANISVSEKTADIRGGVILRCGDIEINCSVESVIADMRTTWESKVAKILFSSAKSEE